MSPLQQHNHKGWLLIDVVSMAFVINVIKWLLWTVETMYFDVVEPVFYICSNFPRNDRYSWGLAVSRLAAGKMIYSN